MLLDFFIKKHECKHNNVPIDTDEAYCPDCGALVRNKWYLVRCSCCNIKRSAHIHYEEIVPDKKFCPNCGSEKYYIEELDNINFLNVNYAVFKREVVEQAGIVTRQIWVEKDDNHSKKLLAGNLSH